MPGPDFEAQRESERESDRMDRGGSTPAAESNPPLENAGPYSSIYGAPSIPPAQRHNRLHGLLQPLAPPMKEKRQLLDRRTDSDGNFRHPAVTVNDTGPRIQPRGRTSALSSSLSCSNVPSGSRRISAGESGE